MKGRSNRPGTDRTSATPSWPWRLGLRARLVLVVLFATLPMLGLMVSSAYWQQWRDLVQARHEVLAFSRFAGESQKRLFGASRQFLATLAQLPEVRTFDGPSCDALTAGLRRESPQFVLIGAADLDGDVFCASSPRTQPLNVAERRFFKWAVSQRDFAIGGYLIEPTSGAKALTVGFPVLSDRGEVTAVVFAMLDLAWLRDLASSATLPPQSVFTMIDRDGTILVREPDHDSWAGRPIGGTEIGEVILAGQESVVDVHGVDGVRRIYAVSPLRITPVAVDAYISVGIRKAFILSDSNRVLAIGLVSFGLTILAVLSIIWFAMNALILKDVEVITAAARRLEEGDLHVRIGARFADRDLGGLARAFDGMAESFLRAHRDFTRRLDQKTAELTESVRRLKDHDGQLEALIEGLPIGVFVARAPGGEAVRMNRRGIELVGRDLDRSAREGTYSETYGIEKEDGTPYPAEELPLGITLKQGVPSMKDDVFIRRPDGSRVHLRVRSAPVKDERGEITSVVVVFEERRKRSGP